MPARVPSSTAARIAAGSSVRGLSSVTTRTSASRAAISPMIGRLPGSRSPPAPEHDDQPAVGERPQALEGGLDGVRLVGVVDDHREVLAGVDPLEPAGHPTAARDRRSHRPRVEPGLGAGGDGGQRVGDVEGTRERYPGLDVDTRAVDEERRAVRIRTYVDRRQSASRPSAEKVRTGSVVSLASRRPCSSSTLTSASRARSGVNSEALAR